MFSLLQQQFAFENETLRTTTAEIAQTAAGGAGEVDERETTRTLTNPVGAVATAPPEPIEEIRDIIQSFVRAEAFYRAMFFRESTQANTELTIEQATGGADRPATTPATTTATSTTEAPTQSLDPTAVPDVAPEQMMSSPAAQTDTLFTPADLPTANDIPTTKKASFYYPDIINIQVIGTDDVQNVFIRGVDSTGRQQALEALQRIRTGDLSQADTDIELIRTVSLAPEIPLTSGANNAAIFADIETQIRTRNTISNLRGDVDVLPKPEAIQLFQSYESAMRYCARPICTLDEYIAFLGDNGLRNGLVEPQGARAANDSRMFPAVYYTQIRQYIDGPPTELPTTNITNTDFISGQDGVAGTVSPAAGQPLSGLPENFPETRAAWSRILRLYRERALNKLPPRT
jgi:hypothetical protein